MTTSPNQTHDDDLFDNKQVKALIAQALRNATEHDERSCAVLSDNFERRLEEKAVAAGLVSSGDIYAEPDLRLSAVARRAEYAKQEYLRSKQSVSAPREQLSDTNSEGVATLISRFVQQLLEPKVGIGAAAVLFVAMAGVFFANQDADRNVVSDTQYRGGLDGNNHIVRADDVLEKAATIQRLLKQVGVDSVIESKDGASIVTFAINDDKPDVVNAALKSVDLPMLSVGRHKIVLLKKQ